MKTAKIGGSSLANALQIRKDIDIIISDSSRRAIVVSAPGKRNSEDTKITDLLYAYANSAHQNSRKTIAKTIVDRYQDIADDLGIKVTFAEWFYRAVNNFRGLSHEKQKDFFASRGEYWMARIMALALDYEFIDADRFIIFKKNGQIDLTKTRSLSKKLCLKGIADSRGIVVPGFYGAMPDGAIKTFSRGGSDITGAIVALCTNSTIYENWTDVNGVLAAHPHIVDNPRKTDAMTYRELRELAYMGANVLHEDAIFPVRKAGIPINIRNTNNPNNSGTLIATNINEGIRTPGSIVGIAGKKGFSVIKIDKALMNNEVGFLRRLCFIMAKHKINIEHIPGGIDTISIIVAEDEFNPIREKVLLNISKLCKPDSLTVETGMAMICIAIADMAKSPNVTARICYALATANINIRMVNQGASAISIIIGVNENDCENAIRAIYEAFKI